MYDLIINGKLEGLYSCQYTGYGKLTSVMFNYGPYCTNTRFFDSIEEMTETITKENLEEIENVKGAKI